jgi:hypothetical protein
MTQELYYWFAGLGLFSLTAVTVGLLIYDRLIRHKCPTPPQTVLKPTFIIGVAARYE